MCFDASYSSLREIARDAEVVLVGKVMSQRTEVDRRGRVPWTLSRVEVLRPLKGGALGVSSLDVEQVGGPGPNQQTSLSDAFPILAVGTTYLLFLSAVRSEKRWGGAVVYVPVGAPQGVYPVNANGAVSSLTEGAALMGIALRDVPLDDVVTEVLAAAGQPSRGAL